MVQPINRYMGGEIEKERSEPMPGGVEQLIADRMHHLYPFAFEIARTMREDVPSDVRAQEIVREWIQREIDEAYRIVDRRYAAERAEAAGYRLKAFR